MDDKIRKIREELYLIKKEKEREKKLQEKKKIKEMFKTEYNIRKDMFTFFLEATSISGILFLITDKSFWKEATFSALFFTIVFSVRFLRTRKTCNWNEIKNKSIEELTDDDIAKMKKVLKVNMEVEEKEVIVLWYCKVRFISGKEEDIIFSNKCNAEISYDSIVKGEKQFIKDYYGRLINFKNVEIITKPEEFKA